MKSSRWVFPATLAVTILCLGLLSSTACAQDSQSSESSEQAINFPIPVATGTIGTKAPGAVSEVAAHIRAVSAAGWQDLEGTGTLTFPEGDTHSASLYLQGSEYTRFDIELNSGTRSLRLHNYSGKFQDESGNSGSLPPMTSATGVVAFPRVWAGAATSQHVSLFDHGLYTGTGQSLHRITIEYQCI
jgi:hypothetical protein